MDLASRPTKVSYSKLEQLEEGFTNSSHHVINATLIDGGLLLHSFLSTTEKITSYGSLARKLLVHVCRSTGNEIHILFDTYQPMSLKTSERKLRGADDTPFLITGPDQTPRQTCHRLLQNVKFKDQLATFLLKEWQEDHYGSTLANNTVIISHGGDCISHSFKDSRMSVQHPDISKVDIRKQTPFLHSMHQMLLGL